MAEESWWELRQHVEDGRPASGRQRLLCTNRLNISLPPGFDMATVRKTTTLPEQQDQWGKAQIAAGDFSNDSEYIRNLIRRDQEQNAKFLALKAAIREGLSSGVSDKTVPQIMEEVEARLRADGRL